MELDLGQCVEHNRHLEAYCTQCNVMVCPSCVMFGEHKGHEVTEPEQAVRNLRDRFDDNIKSGKLKAEFTDSYLTEIRQALVQCDQQRNKILKDVDKVMNDLIQVLKDRKNEVIVHVDEYFKTEKEKVLLEEQKWRERQRISEELLRLSSKKDSDQEILSKSKYITEGLEQLNEKQKFNEMKLINSMDAILHHQDDAQKAVDITSNELVQLFKGYLQINEYKRISFKC
eukprot:403340133